MASRIARPVGSRLTPNTVPAPRKRITVDAATPNMERESFFYNNDASDAASLPPWSASRTGEGQARGGEDPAESLRDQMFEEAKQRQANIEEKYEYLEERVRAGEAFAEWQYQMTRVQTKAGKRNVVNTAVWDGDGGLRAEEQGLANTVEHSLGVAGRVRATRRRRQQRRDGRQVASPSCR